MAIELKMPALSPTMEEGTLAKWLVKEGDTVKSGDILAEIETDKATMEYEAIDEGTIQCWYNAAPESVEELRVGLFAQALGTAVPVSAKRVRSALRTAATAAGRAPS